MRIEQARRLKELEKENTRFKKLVVDISLNNAIKMAWTKLPISALQFDDKSMSFWR